MYLDKVMTISGTISELSPLSTAKNYTDFSNEFGFGFWQKVDFNQIWYRVSEGKVGFLIWLWEEEIYKCDYIWRYFWNSEMWTFWLLEPIFKKVT